MKKYIFSFVCLCCALLPALEGQAHEYPNHPELRKSDANIVGHILDKNTKEHLPYITVALKGTTIGTVTDATGHYFLKNLPEGNFVLEVSSVGYKTVRRNVTLKKGRTLEEDFEIEEDAVALDGVVVSANRNETTRRLAPTLVNVVDLKIFENTNSTTLAQGLSFQPGVRVESNCQNCGFQQVRINGLDGPYTQILLDSRPIFSALSGVYGIEQIPASMIERVEVMRGGGSALFGSSAIAGTINIITKEPMRNSGMLSHTITGIGDGDAFDNSTALNASLVTDDQRAGLYIFGQNRHRSAYDHDGDGYSEIPKIHGQTIGFRSFLKTTTYSKLTFEYHHMEEFRRGGDLLNRPPHEANVAEQTEHSINGGGLKFDYFSPNEKHRFNVFASAQHINRDSYYGGGQDPNAYGNTTDLNWMAGSQYVYSFGKCIFMPADLTAGIEFNQDKLEDNMWGYHRTVDQKVNIGSAFFQNEWKNEHWGFLIGGRLDKHNLIDHVIFSPRANLRYNPTENINLRFSYSSGFRAPQAFDEDLHVENVGGNVAMVELADNCIDKLSKADLRRDDIQLRKSVCSFTPEKMAGKEMLIGAVCTGKYDLRPDFNNFDRLTKDFDLGISPRNYDVAALLYISENGYAGLMEADHFHPFSYQYEFKELAEKLGDSMKARREAPLSAHDFGYVALQMVMHLHDCTNRLAMIKRPYVPTIITRLYPLISMTIWNMKRKEVFLCQTMNLKLRTITMIILSYRILIKHLKRQLQR